MADKETAGKNPLIDKLFSVGAHFGYTRTRRHPSVSPFIFGAKNKVEIFDLEETAKLLERARQYAYELGQQKKMILFVSGKHEVKNLIREAAESIDMPYVAGRWIGGTLTNFTEVRKRVDRLERLRDERESGELEKKYTKREQLEFTREIEKLAEQFGGLVSMKQLPTALFVIDIKHEAIAVREAHHKNVAVIGLTNSDGNIKDATYPIVGNDSAVKSVQCFVDEIVGAYKEGLAHPASGGEKSKEEASS